MNGIGYTGEKFDRKDASLSTGYSAPWLRPPPLPKPQRRKLVGFLFFPFIRFYFEDLTFSFWPCPLFCQVPFPSSVRMGPPVRPSAPPIDHMSFTPAIFSPLCSQCGVEIGKGPWSDSYPNALVLSVLVSWRTSESNEDWEVTVDVSQCVLQVHGMWHPIGQVKKPVEIPIRTTMVDGCCIIQMLFTGTGTVGTEVRVRRLKLYCRSCFHNDRGDCMSYTSWTNV